MPWFDDRDALDRPIADGGPRTWRRADMAEARGVAKRPLPEVTVSNVRSTDDSIEFDVSETGVPVMVNASYFPNWEAEGAEGPWRATPNFMVVVPTGPHVRLTFATSTAEWLGRALSVVGLVGLSALVWWGAGGSAAGSAGAGEDRRPRRVRFRSRAPR